MPKTDSGFWRRHLPAIAFIAVISGGVILYTRGLTTNPAGFFIDESSIAYNAHLISQTGKDEHGESWPLYFRAFGEYKNPVHVYVLAALFRLTGPGIFVARISSATFGLLAALLLGLLAFRICGQWIVALMVLLTTLLTPWLFELSRVAIEVTLYPLAVALFLLCVRRSAERKEWDWTDALSLAATLALLTYTYSIGRVFAPLLAMGLILFFNRERRKGLILAWSLYLLSLAPLLVFHLRHPGALESRFRILTYISPQSSYIDDAWQFGKHFVRNLNPVWMTLTGDPNKYQIAAIYGCPPMLMITFLLAIFGIFLMVKQRFIDRWWAFVLFGLIAAFVPSALTNEYFHTLRHCAVPVFLIVLSIPALMWLTENAGFVRRSLFLLIVVATVAQGAAFQWRHHQAARDQLRLTTFDEHYPSMVLPTALAASGSQTIYLADSAATPYHIHAFWYATVRHIPHDKFSLLAPDAGAPEGAVVISTETICPRCRKLYEGDPYTVYVAEGPPRKSAPLPPSAFRAEIRALGYPQHLGPKQWATIRLSVKNVSQVKWLAAERSNAPFQLRLGNHWLDKLGKMVTNDDARSTLMRDLAPGDEIEFDLTVSAPNTPGEYLLEIDMLQEDVSWFGSHGSKTIRLPIIVD
jgi:4-amino-4-deoxy-L-arabinose transferase-like glycosyltransferase